MVLDLLSLAMIPDDEDQGDENLLTNYDLELESHKSDDDEVITPQVSWYYEAI